ncbi:hypothetical protein G6F24_015719 [Rhizopus arrhizus]|nr:hypothetical protein G6F24_015719 [Rhizopus arrhizus]
MEARRAQPGQAQAVIQHGAEHEGQQQRAGSGDQPAPDRGGADLGQAGRQQEHTRAHPVAGDEEGGSDHPDFLCFCHDNLLYWHEPGTAGRGDGCAGVRPLALT